MAGSRGGEVNERDDDSGGSGVPPDRVVARLYPSAARRGFGTAVLGGLGLLLLWVALRHPPAALGWLVFLLVAGGLVLWGAVRLWQATEGALELTPHELREAGGRRLALVSEMNGVSRGALAFKPSNGFLVTLDRTGPLVWAPGLWWRVGRRLGIGGVTARHEARFMAETLAAMIAARRGE